MSRIVSFEERSSPAKTDSIHLAKDTATAVLTIHKFQDNEHFVVYMSSLNLSAYGENAKEATDRLIHEVLDDFFENLLALKPEQANNELQKLGWKRNKLFKKQFTANSYVDRNGVLKNFNLPEETKIETAVVTV